MRESILTKNTLPSGSNHLPTTPVLERPTGSPLGDSWIRTTFLGGESWVWTIHDSQADAEDEANPFGIDPAGSAGSQDPEGCWPFTNSASFPPNVTGWKVASTIPALEDAPSSNGFIVWNWTTASAVDVHSKLCAALQEFTGEGQALDGVTVYCGEPGEQRDPKAVVVLPTDDVSSPVASVGSTAWEFGFAFEIRIPSEVAEIAVKTKEVEILAGQVSAILDAKRDEFGSVHFELEGEQPSEIRGQDLVKIVTARFRRVQVNEG